MADLNIKQRSEQVGIGTMVLSVDSTNRSPCVVIKDTGVRIHSKNPGIGITIDDTGISFQGKMSFLSSGPSISKGNYSENSNSYKPFTSPGQSGQSSAAIAAIYEQLGKQGIDTSTFTKIGAPIVTDIAVAPGVPPHAHTIIASQHVHPVEPAYLYKLSPLLTGMSSALSSFNSFLTM